MLLVSHSSSYPVIPSSDYSSGHKMAPKFREGDTVVAFSGKWVSWLHTVVAYSAFIGALVTGLACHYQKLVENEYYVRDRLITLKSYANAAKGVSARMVSIGLRNYWRPLSGTRCLPILHRNDLG